MDSPSAGWTSRDVFIFITRYLFELLAVVGVFGYLACYRKGAQANVDIAQNWIKACLPVLKRQFAVVGDSSGYLRKVAHDQFTLWCSGRRKCEWMLAILRLNKRQDFYHWLRGRFTGARDELLLEIEMREDALSQAVLCLIRDSRVTDARSDYQDLKRFTTKSPADDMGLAGFSILSESSEVTQKLLNKDLLAVVTRYQQYIEYIHVSDQYFPAAPDSKKDAPFKQLDVPPAKRLRFMFSFPEDCNWDEVGQMLEELVCYMIDKSRINLSVLAKTAADKLRVRIASEREVIAKSAK